MKKYLIISTCCTIAFMQVQQVYAAEFYPDEFIFDEFDSEVSDPEVSDPEVSDSEIYDPEVSDPEVSDPDVSDPDVLDSFVDDVSSNISITSDDLLDSQQFIIDYIDGLNLLSSDNLIELLSSYGSNTGIISEPYLSYIRSCLSWMGVDDNYVAFVSSYTYGNNTYTYYVCAIGDISYSGSYFYADSVSLFSFYPNATPYGNFRHEFQSNFRYTPANSLCFSNISDSFPDIRGQDTRLIYIIVCFIALFVVFYTVTKFGWRTLRKRRGSKCVL